MRIKSFFAASVEAALDEAQRELGPEAMLIQSRPAPPDARDLGDYEVVCAVLPADAPPTTLQPEAVAGNARASVPGRSELQRLSGDLDALRSTVERLQSSVVRHHPLSGGPPIPPGFESTWSALLDTEIDRELASRLITRAAAEADLSPDQSPVSFETAGKLVRQEIAATVRVRSFPQSNERTILMLVGPPGAGKTACIASIAAHLGVAAGRSTEIIVVDEHRVAPAEPLRTYSAILGTAYRVLTRAHELGQVLEDAHWKDLVLIDTPGFSLAEGEACKELAVAVQAQAAETHLVLPCSMRSCDLRRVSEFYAVFHPSALIFTRLDETRVRGPIVNEAEWMQLPVSFLATGTRIPEHLERADAEAIADLVLPPSTTVQCAATAGM